MGSCLCVCGNAKRLRVVVFVACCGIDVGVLFVVTKSKALYWCDAQSGAEGVT